MDGLHYWIGLTDIFVEGKEIKKEREGKVKLISIRSVEVGGNS